MKTVRVHLEGPEARGQVVDAGILRTTLGVLIDGSQQAIRLRTQGRSTASGSLPRWIEAATPFRVTIREGSTVLDLEAPTILEAAPDEFSQELSPRLTGGSLRRFATLAELTPPLPSTALAVPQDARSGLAAIVGKWPGEETDGELATALEQHADSV